MLDVGLERKRGVALIIEVGHSVAHNFFQCFANVMAQHVHAYTMGLHDGCRAIAVDDQSGQVVALTVYKTVGVVLRIVHDAYRTAHLQRRQT